MSAPTAARLVPDDTGDELQTALAAAAGDAPDAAIDRLLPWLTDTRWLAQRLSAAVAPLATDPYARPMLHMVGEGGGAGGLILAECGTIRLSLQLQPVETGSAAPTTITFVPGHIATRILRSGGAQVAAHHVALTAAEAAGAFTAAAATRCTGDPARPLRDGEILRRDGARTAWTLFAATGDVLALELAITPRSPLPVRTHDRASGRLIHLAASRRDSSFRTMALTLLRDMARRDAAPLFEQATHSDDFAARWAAMREFSALAPAAAHSRLAAMAAADPHPEVRAAAKATLALYAPRPLAGGAGGGRVEQRPPKSSGDREGFRETPCPAA